MEVLIIFVLSSQQNPLTPPQTQQIVHCGRDHTLSDRNEGLPSPCPIMHSLPPTCSMNSSSVAHTTQYRLPTLPVPPTHGACHDPIHSDHSDSILMISDCFRRFTSLMDHPLAPGPAPLDRITFILLLLHSLHIYSLMYIVTSPQLEDRIDHRSPTSLPSPNSAPYPLSHSRKT